MPNPLFTFYGDDFTGSTDALEALELNGVPAVLFLALPDESKLARFSHAKAIGIAGESRSRSPEWMSQHLPAIFRGLKALGGEICQYKVCSTFDSSPEIGSIGRALEIGAEVFGSRFVPIVAAAPHLGRYVCFGNLFAAAGDDVYRIDRHPTMSRHPVTPMHEGDLRLHLAGQTERRICLFDIVSLESASPGARFETLLQGGLEAVLFDALNESSINPACELIWKYRSLAPFAVGSSGLTHGLARLWPSEEQHFEDPGPADRLIVLTGSCSPVTERQIRYAACNGFAAYTIDPLQFQAESIIESALKSLESGKSVVLYSALGRSDFKIGVPREELGIAMGNLVRDLLMRSGVKRAVIAGGDTSSYAARQLGLYALTFRAPLARGAPLCKAHSDDPAFQDLELVLKGGQIGPEDFFEWALTGERAI